MARSTVRLLVIIAATLVTSVAAAAQRSYDRQLAAPAGGHLTFHTQVGSVRVVGHSAEDVTIHADLQGPKSFLDRLHISARQTASGVRISARLADGSWFHWFDFGSHHRVRFTVEVPRDYPVELRTSGGNLEVQDLNAAVRAWTSGGRVRVQNITGTVNAHTSGGNIEASQINGPTQLSSSGGSIRIEDSTGTLELHTAGGNIRIHNADGRVHAVTSGGDIRAALRSNQGISLRSGGGDITLLLPLSTRASLDAKTGGGSVSSDFPFSTTQIVSGSHLQGTIGGGGAAISLYSGGGDIRIRPEN